MPGFFPHTGLQTSAYTPLPKTTGDNLLNDIVADIGAGVNGWTLWDDQRTNLTDLYYPPVINFGIDRSTYLSGYGQYVYYAFVNGNSTGTCYMNNTEAAYDWYRAVRSFAPSGSSGNVSGSQITLDGTNFYTIVNVYPGSGQATDNPKIYLDRNFAQGSVNVAAIRAKIWGYIVLKCTSAQKTFYVKLTRPASNADGLMVRAFETWDNVAHSGTVGGPSEILRTHNTNVGVKSTDALRYVLWLLPDVFGLYMGGDPYNGNPASKISDFIYIGNLTPYRAGDTDCLIQCCTNNEYSGLAAMAGSTYAPGVAVCLRGLNPSNTWADPTVSGNPPAVGYLNTGGVYYVPRYTGGCMYQISPKGVPYYQNPWRAAYDNYGRFQICELGVFSAEQCSNGSGNPLGNEGKRGDMKHVKLPLFNPSGFNLVQFGPADDGNTYLIIRADFPYGSVTAGYNYGINYPPVTPGGSNVGPNVGVWSGWAHGTKTYVSGEITDGGGSMICVPNYFLMPTNL